MRILLVTHYYPPEVGAPQRRWGALVERFVRAGHQVAVLAPPPHYPHGRAGELPPEQRPGAVVTGPHGERVHRLRFREYGGEIGSRGRDQLVAAADAVRVGLRRFSGAHRPDVVVATVPGLPSLPAGVALATVLRVPLVVEMRDAWPDLLRMRAEWDEATTADRSGVPRTLAGMLGDRLPGIITSMQRRADAVVTTTESFAEVLRARGMRRVTVIRNGARLPAAPTPPTRPTPLADRTPTTNPTPPTDLAAEELRVLYLGTIGRSQGLATAVRAAARAGQHGVPVRLRIVGEGADVPQLAELVNQLAAPVTLEPPVPHEEVGALYSWADTVLVTLRSWAPLRWTVPSKLYEALAVGRHVTAVVAGEAAGIVETTQAGTVLTPGDETALAQAWARLHRDRSTLQVGTGGRDWVGKHSDEDALADRYLQVLTEVTGG